MFAQHQRHLDFRSNGKEARLPFLCFLRTFAPFLSHVRWFKACLCVIQRWLGDVSSVWVSRLYCQIILHSRLFRLYCQIIIIISLLSNCQYLMFGTCIPPLNKSLLLLFIILPCGIHACVCLSTCTK